MPQEDDSGDWPKGVTLKAERLMAGHEDWIREWEAGKRLWHDWVGGTPGASIDYAAYARLKPEEAERVRSCLLDPKSEVPRDLSAYGPDIEAARQGIKVYDRSFIGCRPSEWVRVKAPGLWEHVKTANLLFFDASNRNSADVLSAALRENALREGAVVLVQWQMITAEKRHQDLVAIRRSQERLLEALFAAEPGLAFIHVACRADEPGGLTLADYAEAAPLLRSPQKGHWQVALGRFIVVGRSGLLPMERSSTAVKQGKQWRLAVNGWSFRDEADGGSLTAFGPEEQRSFSLVSGETSVAIEQDPRLGYANLYGLIRLAQVKVDDIRQAVI